MDGQDTFQRENQRVPASDLLQALASGQEIKLTGCTVSGAVDVNRLFVKSEDFDIASLASDTEDNVLTLTFDQSISLKSCVFEDNVCFSALWENSGQLQVIFKRDVIFNMSEFKAQALFTNANFKAPAAFDGCTFDHIAVWREAHFTKRAMFRTVAFNGYGIFSDTVFDAETRFTNTCFSKGANFTKTMFRGITDFSGCYSQGKSVPLYESVHFARHRYGTDETFWRFIKQASQDAGYYRVSGECFYKERCAHVWSRLRGSGYDHLSSGQKFMRMLSGVRVLPEVVFGRLLFGYGERPVRVLFVGLFIIIAC
ncbi:MAG: pentapeptide repeat-containing protein, partial [Anaerohalosphaera sp.]|nr:pentapeptide repeat-containing protein [Anaerohalosphaera sp.]